MMRALSIACALAALSLAASCAHPTVYQARALDCAKVAGSAELANIDKILMLLSGEDWFGALEQLALPVPALILCEALVLRDWLSARAPAEPASAARLSSVVGCGGQDFQAEARLDAWIRYRQARFGSKGTP